MFCRRKLDCFRRNASMDIPSSMQSGDLLRQIAYPSHRIDGRYYIPG